MKEKRLWLWLAVLGCIIFACVLVCNPGIVQRRLEQALSVNVPQLPSRSPSTTTPIPTNTQEPTNIPHPTDTPTVVRTPKPSGLLGLQHSYAKAVLTRNGFVCDDLAIIKSKYGRYCRFDRLMEDGFVYIVELYGEDKKIVDYISASITTEEPQTVIDFFSLVAALPYKGTLPESVQNWIEQEVRNPDDGTKSVFNGMTFDVFGSSMIISEP